jgi:hypothetical protein
MHWVNFAKASIKITQNMIKIATKGTRRSNIMYKRLVNLRRLNYLILLSVITGCSSILNPEREFSEPVSGSIIVAQSLFKDKKSTSCESKSQKEKQACQKQVDALAQSITDAKAKSNQDGPKID